jgi:flagellar biogenesis protein FliO
LGENLLLELNEAFFVGRENRLVLVGEPINRGVSLLKALLQRFVGSQELIVLVKVVLVLLVKGLLECLLTVAEELLGLLAGAADGV